MSIAFGTGANVAIFSAVDALLLRPLPVERPGDLLTIGSRVRSGVATINVASHPDYRDIRRTRAHVRRRPGGHLSHARLQRRTAGARRGSGSRRSLAAISSASSASFPSSDAISATKKTGRRTRRCGHPQLRVVADRVRRRSGRDRTARPHRRHRLHRRRRRAGIVPGDRVPRHSQRRVRAARHVATLDCDAPASIRSRRGLSVR